MARRGQALVEFAIVSPLLFFLLLAVLEVGAAGVRLVAWQQLVGSMATAVERDGALPAWWADRAAAGLCGAPAASVSGTDPLLVELACDYAPLSLPDAGFRVTVSALAIPAPTPAPSGEEAPSAVP